MERNQNREFARKVWIAGGILALIAVILWLFAAVFSVLLLILAGVLISVFFRGLSSLIERKTGWSSALSVTLSIVGTLVITLGLIWLLGAKAQTQITQLSDKLPETIENAKAKLNQFPLGQRMVKYATSDKAQKQARSLASTFFKSTFGVLGDIYVVLFLGIFITANPQIYRTGIIKMVPEAGRDRAGEVLDKLWKNLTKWLKGQLFAMLVVFILTAIGLAIIGVPMWLALALIAGFLNFIPNFGPLIAMIPAVLVALMQGPATAGFVAGLYILVQVVESNFITPMVQQKLVHIPPALIIIAQLLMGALTGGWGIVLATPLMVLVMVTIQELYVKRIENAKSK